MEQRKGERKQYGLSVGVTSIALIYRQSKLFSFRLLVLTPDFDS